LVVNSGATFGSACSNTFSNLDYDGGYLGGQSNLYACNVFEQCNGWEAMHFMGFDNVFRRNFIRNSAVKGYSNISADVFETFGGADTHGIVFEQNFVQNFDGVLGILRSGAISNMWDVVFRSNVFFQVSWCTLRIPQISFINNTFYQVATGATEVVEATAHPLVADGIAGMPSGHSATLKNNIFVACGNQAKDVEVHGWYTYSGVTNFVADYNFVAGAAPGFAAKVGFDEGDPNLNGGDPGFVNISDPLGPDELPFTADDGLRLTSSSKLLGQGEGGVDLGAYNAAGDPLVWLSIARRTDGSLRISWPTSAEGFVLQSAAHVTDGWTGVGTAPAMEGTAKVVVLEPTNPAALYRLAK
jgi:hypothetical protein